MSSPTSSHHSFPNHCQSVPTITWFPSSSSFHHPLVPTIIQFLSPSSHYYSFPTHFPSSPISHHHPFSCRPVSVNRSHHQLARIITEFRHPQPITLLASPPQYVIITLQFPLSFAQPSSVSFHGHPVPTITQFPLSLHSNHHPIRIITVFPVSINQSYHHLDPLTNQFPSSSSSLYHPIPIITTQLLPSQITCHHAVPAIMFPVTTNYSHPNLVSITAPSSHYLSGGYVS